MNAQLEALSDLKIDEERVKKIRKSQKFEVAMDKYGKLMMSSSDQPAADPLQPFENLSGSHG